MKIQSIKLRGFIGIKKGMGLDEVSLELSGIGGLIALAGPNGKGKTTILENLQPFRALASRKKALQHHVFLRDSYRDLCFSFGGDEYRTLVKIDSESGNQEGFIWKNEASQVDGRVREYDRYITDLLGSSNLFFNSVFCAQGSEKISDMRTGDLKALFSEFLQLGLLEGYEETSKQCFNVLSGIAGEIESEIIRLEASIADLDELRAKGFKLIADNQELTNTISDAEAAVLLAEKNLRNAEIKVRENKILAERISAHDKAVEVIKAEIQNDKKESTAELDALRLEAMGLADAKKNFENSLANADKIVSAITQTGYAEISLLDRTKEIENLTNQLSQISTTIVERDKVLAKIRVEMKSLHEDNEGATMRAQIQSHKARVLDLDKRDQECVSDVCSFIVSALSSRDTIPILENKLRNHRGLIVYKIDLLRKDISDIVYEIERHKVAQAELEEKRSECVKAVIRLKSEIAGLKDLVDQAPAVRVAEERLVDLRARYSEIVLAGMEKKELWDGKILAKQQRLKIAEDTLSDAIRAINPGAEEVVSRYEGAVQDLRDIISKKQAEFNELGLDIHSSKMEIAEKEGAAERLKAAMVRRSLVSAEASEWKYLKDACSKDGLRALEIDAVTPTINLYSNELLYHAYGGETVKLITQNEDGREVLDILIIDQDGEETLLSDRSGGEKVWPLKTIRLAMARLNNEKSGRDFRTLLADEEDGPLSLDNARRFVSLYRAIVTANQAGVKTFDDCFYITHKPECVAMADHVLRFTGEGVEVE